MCNCQGLIRPKKATKFDIRDVDEDTLNLKCNFCYDSEEIDVKDLSEEERSDLLMRTMGEHICRRTLH